MGDGKSRQIPVFGVDATEAAVDLIRKGRMTGTVKQDAEGMAKAVSILATNGIGGKPLAEGMDDYTVDNSVFKIRIPYSQYLGDEK
jgi:methyl-galactoside transport system substrate-binding protein